MMVICVLFFYKESENLSQLVCWTLEEQKSTVDCCMLFIVEANDELLLWCEEIHWFDFWTVVYYGYLLSEKQKLNFTQKNH